MITVQLYAGRGELRLCDGELNVMISARGQELVPGQAEKVGRRSINSGVGMLRSCSPVKNSKHLNFMPVEGTAKLMTE